MALTLENVVPPSLFVVNGDVTFSEGQSTGGFPGVIEANPKNIQVDQGVTFNFKWNQSGPLSNFLIGSWKCDVFFEKLGPGDFDPAILAKTTPFVFGTHSYSLPFVIAPNSIPEGIYRLTVRLMLKPINASLPSNSPIASFQDLGIVEFYVG